MLADSDVMPTIAVKDLAVAKEFYGSTLGLKQVDENPGGVTYQSGNSKLFVYASQSAGTNQATYVGWDVEDVESAVQELQDKNLKFEKYDLPGTTKIGDGTILDLGGERAAWFKDPDGNILSVGS